MFFWFCAFARWVHGFYRFAHRLRERLLRLFLGLFACAVSYVLVSWPVCCFSNFSPCFESPLFVPSFFWLVFGCRVVSLISRDFVGCCCRATYSRCCLFGLARGFSDCVRGFSGFVHGFSVFLFAGLLGVFRLHFVLHGYCVNSRLLAPRLRLVQDFSRCCAFVSESWFPNLCASSCCTVSLLVACFFACCIAFPVSVGLVSHAGSLVFVHGLSASGATSLWFSRGLPLAVVRDFSVVVARLLTSCCASPLWYLSSLSSDINSLLFSILCVVSSVLYVAFPRGLCWALHIRSRFPGCCGIPLIIVRSL